MKTREKTLAGMTTTFTPVVDAGFLLDDYRAIDLSVENPELQKFHLDSSISFQHFLNDYLKRSGGKVAYGGYNEKRNLYRRSSLFSEDGNSRNVHLGIDIWAPEGTAVLAVLPGKVHSFHDNKGFGDYGPTIIVQHELEDLTFYSLYGHLSRRSLQEMEQAKQLVQGETLGWLGEPEVNGNYAPHLHFQIILDLQGRVGDFPGVANTKDLPSYLQNCPDPNLLLKIQ